MNPCHFSPCRSYRYTLEHVFEPTIAEHRIQWIGLNPSTADENKLDPTLRRVREFSRRLGHGAFVMTNVFAYRATKPAEMRAQADPVGPQNDEYLMLTAKRCAMSIACWGGLSKFPRSLRHRAASIRLMFAKAEIPLLCLGRIADGSPEHPLFVESDRKLELYLP